MAQRMTKDKWDAVFSALSRGIDEMEAELENLDPNDQPSYGTAEYQWEQAKLAYRILLHRAYKA